MILFSAEAILASNTSKFGNWNTSLLMTKILNHPMNQPSPLLWSHCKASVRNCEQIHTSVLNLIFQQAKVAVVRKLVEMKIRNLQSLFVCPIILWRVSSTEDDWFFGWRYQTGISDIDLVLAFHFFSTVDEWSGSSRDEFHWCNSLLDKVLMKTHLDLQKRFPDLPCVSQMHCGPSLRLGVTKECLNIPSSIGWGGNDTGTTGNVGISIAYWFSILKILRIVHTIYFILQFLYSARKAPIWCSDPR